MMEPNEHIDESRRGFLSGQSLQDLVHAAVGREPRDHSAPVVPVIEPTGGPTLRLGTRAMACDFGVVLNPGAHSLVSPASDALELVHQLEQQLTVYRHDSEVSQINDRAADEPVPLEAGLYDRLALSLQLVRDTDGGFDPTSGPTIDVWRRARRDGRVPTEEEIAETQAFVGSRHLTLDEDRRTVRFATKGVELNFGAIGKGYALDRAAEVLEASGAADFLLHGGHSSLLARGGHGLHEGWPVGLRNPLFTDRRLGTVLIRNQAMSTSGSNIQYYRHEGKRYGHILDPRTGMPVEGMLSAVVLAPTAALADALSTAFFVIGVENAAAYCHNHKDVTALLIPPPSGRRLCVLNCGVPSDQLFFVSQDSPDSADICNLL